MRCLSGGVGKADMCLEKGLESRRLCVMDKQQGEICGRRNRVGNTVEGRAAPGTGTSWKEDGEVAGAPLQQGRHSSVSGATRLCMTSSRSATSPSTLPGQTLRRGTRCRVQHGVARYKVPQQRHVDRKIERRGGREGNSRWLGIKR